MPQTTSTEFSDSIATIGNLPVETALLIIANELKHIKISLGKLEDCHRDLDERFVTKHEWRPFRAGIVFITITVGGAFLLFILDKILSIGPR